MAKTKSPQTEAKEILSELEDLWKKFDRIYYSFTDQEWERKFGKDWTYSDQAYHLAFFDRMVATALATPATSKKKPDLMTNFAEINAWNESEFKKRPKKYTAKDSLNDFRKSHELLRIAFAKTKNWKEKVWLPLFFGEVSAVDALNASLIHQVGEYIELCFRTNHPIDVLSSSMKRRVRFMLYFMSLSVNKKAAEKVEKFVMGWQFTGKAQSLWTILVENGEGKLIEGKPKSPDLEMALSLETFEKMLRKMRNPMLMMVTREIKVRGFKNMPTFSKLFPQP